MLPNKTRPDCTNGSNFQFSFQLICFKFLMDLSVKFSNDTTRFNRATLILLISIKVTWLPQPSQESPCSAVLALLCWFSRQKALLVLDTIFFQSLEILCFPLRVWCCSLALSEYSRHTSVRSSRSVATTRRISCLLGTAEKNRKITNGHNLGR